MYMKCYSYQVVWRLFFRSGDPITPQLLFERRAFLNFASPNQMISNAESTLDSNTWIVVRMVVV